MSIRLPPKKVASTLEEVQSLLHLPLVSGRRLAQLIGTLSATLPAILPAPLHYRALQHLKHQALKQGGYDSVVPLSAEARGDLVWWAQNLPFVNGQSLQRPQPSLVIASDASLAGWGACAKGIRIGGPWIAREHHLHINCLELLATTFATKALAKDMSNAVIKLEIDSATAVAYINHLRGTHSLTLYRLAAELWEWSLSRGCFLVATHVPGRLNSVADMLSRTVVDRSDWRLHPSVFQRLDKLWGPLEIDLFASWATAQLPRFFSWKPDPNAEAVDAFLQVWSGIRSYANPPWPLIGRCIQKIQEKGCTVVLITPKWPSQPWFPALLEMLVDFPRLLPERADLIIPPSQMEVPLLPKARSLVAWLISGSLTKQRAFRSRLSSCSWRHGGSPPPRTTTQPGLCGSLGVVDGKSIHLLPL